MFAPRFMILILLAARGALESAFPTDRICETVTAIATGFGEEQVTRFA